jgi:hypothetical protein
MLCSRSHLLMASLAATWVAAKWTRQMVHVCGRVPLYSWIPHGLYQLLFVMISAVAVSTELALQIGALR